MSTMMTIKRVLLALLILLPASLQAHKLAPSLLEIEGLTEQRYSVLWRTPALGGEVTPEPVFPDACQLAPSSTRRAGTSLEYRWELICDGGLTGQELQVRGLTASRTAALLKISLADGRAYTELIRRDGQTFVVPAKPDTWRVVGQYFVLGVEHILIGFDHLLFVTGLLLLAAGWRELLVTVTAFTLGHSVTLACVSLGVIPDVANWVELAIAATILYLALALSYRGLYRSAHHVRWPVIAVFGLIHGLGFASVLDELGLPQGDIIAGLLSFNIGIEVGQILFVAALALLLSFAAKLHNTARPALQGSAIYLMGAMSVFWCLDRGYGLLVESYYFF